MQTACEMLRKNASFTRPKYILQTIVMNINTIQQISAAAAMLPLICSAQLPANDTAQTVKFALTESMTVAGLAQKDSTGKPIKGAPATYSNEYSVTKRGKTTQVEEYGTKILTAKISNKEILEALVEEGVISSISDWSIVNVGSGKGVGRTYIRSGLYLSKKGVEPINVSEYISIYHAGAEAVASNTIATNTYSGAKDSVSTTEEFAGVANGKTLVSVELNFSGMDAQMQGVQSWAQSSLNRYANPLQGAGSIDALTGGVSYYESSPTTRVTEGYDSLLEGSISLSASMPFVFSQPE